MRPGYLACCLLPLLAGCYGMALVEFDSVARWDDPLQEPRRVEWAAKPKMYPWYSFLLPSEALPTEVDNPSGFARERLDDLIDNMGDDLSRIARVARRALWVADQDPNPYNRIAALRGVEIVIRRLGIDPLDGSAYHRDAAPGEGARLDAQRRAAHKVIGDLLLRSDRPAVSETQRAAYLAAFTQYLERPMPRASERRTLIRTLWSVFVLERDRVVAVAARKALVRAIGYALCNGLRAALVPLQVEDFPDVRQEALMIYRRLGGIPALPFVLQMMARPGAIGQRQYDRDPQVRMALVRLCGQLGYEQAVQGTPRPIEFLYLTAVDEAEEGDVRRVALEALARCLHRQRGEQPISLSYQWAKDWWKEFIATQDRQP